MTTLFTLTLTVAQLHALLLPLSLLCFLLAGVAMTRCATLWNMVAPAPAFSMPTPQTHTRPMQRVESYVLVIGGVKLVESLRIVAMQEL